MDRKVTLDGVPVLRGAGVVNADVLTSGQALVDQTPLRPNPREARILNVVVVGTGYVGLVTGAILADQGSNVIGVDNDPSELVTIAGGESPIY